MVYFNWWPFPQSQIKKNPITFVIKMLMHFLFLGHVKFLLSATLILPADEPLKMYFPKCSRMCGCGGILSSSTPCPWPGKSVEGCVVHDFPWTRAALGRKVGFPHLWGTELSHKGPKGSRDYLVLGHWCGRCSSPCPSCGAVGMARRGACRSLGYGSPQFFVSHRALDWMSRGQFSSSLKQRFLLLLPVALRISLGIKGEGISVPCCRSIKTPGGSTSGEEGAEYFPVSHHTQDCVQPWLSKGSSSANPSGRGWWLLWAAQTFWDAIGAPRFQRCVTSIWGSGREWGWTGPSQGCGKLCQNWVHFSALGLLVLWREQGQSFPAGCIFLLKTEKKRETHQNYLRNLFCCCCF